MASRIHCLGCGGGLGKKGSTREEFSTPSPAKESKRAGNFCWRQSVVQYNAEGDQYKRSPPSVTLRKRPRALRKCATATAPVTYKAIARDTPTTHYFPRMRVSCDVLQRSQLAIVYFYCHLSATLLKRY